MYSSHSTEYENSSGSTKQPAIGIPLASIASQVFSGIPESKTLLPHVPEASKSEVGPWSTGLFDFFSDPSICCLTLWCPCITFRRIAEIVDRGSSSRCVTHAMGGNVCCYACSYRRRMRQQYKLEEAPCGDCLVHSCCNKLALCQEYRELQNRGFDMSLGWKENLEKQNRGAAEPPVLHSGMTK